VRSAHTVYSPLGRVRRTGSSYTAIISLTCTDSIDSLQRRNFISAQEDMTFFNHFPSSLLPKQGKHYEIRPGIMNRGSIPGEPYRPCLGAIEPPIQGVPAAQERRWPTHLNQVARLWLGEVYLHSTEHLRSLQRYNFIRQLRFWNLKTELMGYDAACFETYQTNY